MGLPKAHRLKDRQDYRAVYQHGIRYYSPHLVSIALAVRSDEGLPPATKFGISIAKKVSKKAVVRNRIKRQLKSAIGANIQRVLPGWKIVIVVKPTAIECKYEHFLRELEQLLNRAKIINGY